jgi:hypothetical protein
MRAGVQARGMVIGEAWAGPEIRRGAEDREIFWRVGDDLSEELLAFRRFPS